MATWSGRLPGGLAPEAWEFLHSLPHDAFLWPHDCRGTIGHVRGLETARLLSAAQARKLVKELEAMADDPELIEETDEDVHSAIERVLTERLGDLGRKVHTGRSRNDQVATAMRLWLRDELAELRADLVGLVETLAERALETAEVPAPGYTHLQRAQIVSVGHWLCAHAQGFVRDLERVRAAEGATDVSPLGAGALAGSTLPIDPKVSAHALGFARSFANSMDAVSDRDFLCDAAYAVTMIATHLSRLGEDLVIWSSAEVGFVRLPDAYATGSSMMPQKKNPDVAEVARSTAAVALSALVGMVTMLKSLGLAYYRDLQADKRFVPEALAVTRRALRAVRGLVGEVTFDAERLAEATSSDLLLATDLAEALVARGVPFRSAHETVGGLVGLAEQEQLSLTEAVERHPEAVSPLAVADARKALDAKGAPGRRRSPGGPSPVSVRKQARDLKRRAAKATKL